MKVTVTFEVTEQAARLLLDNSIERVINTTMSILDECDDSSDGAPEVIVNRDDWFRCKGPVVNMWNGIRDGVFRAKNDDMKQVSDWIIA